MTPNEHEETMVGFLNHPQRWYSMRVFRLISLLQDEQTVWNFRSTLLQ